MKGSQQSSLNAARPKISLKMTKPGENISLILYEFKLQDVAYTENKISNSDYGSHVIRFLEDTFECKFETLTTIGSLKVIIFLY